MTYAWIVAGAALGAPLRYFVQSRIQPLAGEGFPTGTLVVNVSGCIAIGLLLTLAEQRSWLTGETRLMLVTGFLGGYTTFSAFGWETYQLLRDDAILQAGAYVFASVVVGLLGVWLGVIIARIAGG